MSQDTSWSPYKIVKIILPISHCIAQLAKNMTILLLLKHLVLIMSVNSHFLEKGYSVTEQTVKPVLLQQLFLFIFWKCNCWSFSFTTTFLFGCLIRQLLLSHTTRTVSVIKALLGLPSKHAVFLSVLKKLLPCWLQFLPLHTHTHKFSVSKEIHSLSSVTAVKSPPWSVTPVQFLQSWWWIFHRHC